MDENTTDNNGESYATLPIEYNEDFYGFGAACVFKGPLEMYRHYPHSLVFIASRMPEDEEKNSLFPDWQMAAKIIVEEYNVDTTIILDKNISRENALALIDFYQEETIRMKLYDMRMQEKIVSNFDLSEEMVRLQKNENPLSFDDGEVIENVFMNNRPFPFIMSTGTVLTNFEMYDYSEDEAFKDKYPEYDEDEDDENSNDQVEDVYKSPYTPMEEVNVQRLCETINPDRKDLPAKVNRLERPYMFVAKFQLKEVPFSRHSDLTKLEAWWKVFSVEGKKLTEVMETKYPSEAMWALNNFENAVLDSNINKDKLHSVVKEYSRYHHANWKNEVDEIEQQIRKPGFSG